MEATFSGRLIPCIGCVSPKSLTGEEVNRIASRTTQSYWISPLNYVFRPDWLVSASLAAD